MFYKTPTVKIGMIHFVVHLQERNSLTTVIPTNKKLLEMRSHLL